MGPGCGGLGRWPAGATHAGEGRNPVAARYVAELCTLLMAPKWVFVEKNAAKTDFCPCFGKNVSKNFCLIIESHYLRIPIRKKGL